jgi:hypothetical protein
MIRAEQYSEAESLMPYPQANYFVGLTLLVIVVGFWGSYFTEIGDVPTAFHVHAFTATSWVVLLMLQVWSIHHRRNDLHKLVGKLSLALFPLLMVGFVSIINFSAASFAAEKSPQIMFLGPSFGVGMMVALVAYLTVFYLALKNRRKVRLHAGYMLMTPLILFESPFSRILSVYFPSAVFTGSEGPQFIIDAIVISISLSIVFALAMYLRDRKGGTPFLVAAAFMIVQAILMYVGSSVEWIRAGFAAYAQIPAGVTLALGLLLGIAVSWLGWRSVGGGPAARPAT